MIYIDSAYPASDSIIETEQRTNQMNNLLRVISDLQMSCNYGKKEETSIIHLCFSFQNQTNPQRNHQTDDVIGRPFLLKTIHMVFTFSDTVLLPFIKTLC